MKAFVEITSGIVRVGDDCDEYGKPFTRAAAFSCVDGKTAVVKALTADGKFTPAEARAGIKAIMDLGLIVQWVRFKD